MFKSSLPESVSNHLEALMIDEALNTLSPEEQKVLDSYLLHYPDLAEQRRDIQSTIGLMAHAAVPVTAPPQLKASILRQAELSARNRKEASVLEPIESSLVRSRREVPSPRKRKQMAWGGAIAAGFLLLGLGIDNVNLRLQLRQDRERLATLSEETIEAESHLTEMYTFDLTGTPVVQDAIGRVVLDFEGEKATVAIKNLPVTTDNLAYHLWAFTADGHKIFCGRFQADAKGLALAYLPIDPEVYKADIKFMRISREPAVMPFQPDKRVLVMTSES
jgi:Anti-sigma-K factor rskA